MLFYILEPWKTSAAFFPLLTTMMKTGEYSSLLIISPRQFMVALFTVARPGNSLAGHQLMNG